RHTYGLEANAARISRGYAPVGRRFEDTRVRLAERPKGHGIEVNRCEPLIGWIESEVGNRLALATKHQRLCGRRRREIPEVDERVRRLARRGKPSPSGTVTAARRAAPPKNPNRRASSLSGRVDPHFSSLVRCRDAPSVGAERDVDDVGRAFRDEPWRQAPLLPGADVDLSADGVGEVSGRLVERPVRGLFGADQPGARTVQRPESNGLVPSSDCRREKSPTPDFEPGGGALRVHGSNLSALRDGPQTDVSTAVGHQKVGISLESQPNGVFPADNRIFALQELTLPAVPIP